MSEPTDNTESSAKPKRKKSGIFVILFMIVAFVILNKSEPVNTVDCTPEIIATKPDVIMLGAWWCTYCYKAKSYFQKNKISYCEYDMENTERGKYLYKEKGGGAVPVLLIGKYTLNGFSERQIETALNLLAKTTDSTVDATE